MQDIASKASASVAGHFAKMAGAVLAVGAAFVGVRAAAQSFSAAIALGGQLNDLSARTGESAGNLLILRRAFENAGAGADSVGTTINRLQRAIVEAGQGGKEQAEAFATLGAPSLTYVKAVDVDGHTAYAMHSADGREIAVFDKRETAMVAARQHELEPVSVH